MHGFYLHHTSRLGGIIISSYHFPWLEMLSSCGHFFIDGSSLPVKEAYQWVYRYMNI